MTTDSSTKGGSALPALLIITGLLLSGVAVADYPLDKAAPFHDPDTPSSAQHIRLFTLMPVDTLETTRLSTQPGMRPIRYNSEQVRTLPEGGHVRMPLSEDLDISLTHERTVRNPSGSRTWIGRLTGFPPIYRAIITDDGEHVHGRIMTPRGLYFLETVDGVQRLHNPRASGLQVPPFVDDGIPPPYPLLDPDEDALPWAESLPQSAESNELATIDLLIAYTPGMVTRYGTGLQARFDQLVAIANQAYPDSEIHLRVRIVHTVQVDYSETTSNLQALDDITPEVDPTPASVAMLGNLRDQYGADLVALLRPFRLDEHAGCGNAWLLGWNLAGSLDPVWDAPFGYSVTSDGSDVGGSNFFCSDLALTHEMGHNMGSQHDRANANAFLQPVFEYSYGHGSEGSFGTIMSYISPEVARFSNPSINCEGQPCGIAHPAPDSADNARSINNIRFDLAAFRPMVVENDPCLDDHLVLQNVTVTGIETHEACRITAGPALTVNATGNLTLRAGSRVTLRPGFVVRAGGTFTAEIDPNLTP